MGWSIVAGIMVSFLFILGYRQYIYYSVNKDTKCKIIKMVGCALRVILSIISLDYSLSRKHKKMLTNGKENYKKIRGDYIRKANTVNLIVSFIIVLAIFLLKSFVECEVLYYICLGVIIYRIISRTFEINMSFLKDVVRKENHQSDVLRSERIVLAIKSLIEEFLLFSCLYLFVNVDCLWYESIIGGLHSFILSPYNVCSKTPLLSFLSIYQVICSMILITLSIATYVSDSNENQGNKN